MQPIFSNILAAVCGTANDHVIDADERGQRAHRGDQPEGSGCSD